MRKRYLAAAAAGLAAAAAILAAVLCGPEEKPQTVRPPQSTRPPVTRPVQTAPGETEGDTVPETTQVPLWSEPTEPTEERTPAQPEETEPTRPPEPTAQTPPELFPLELEEGRLTVHTMFSFSGMNPDADLAFGEALAGLQITNTSDRHMTALELTAVLEDGTELTFRAEDIPPGMSAMVFSRENHSLAEGWRCDSLSGFAEFEEEDPLRPELVEITTDGIAVTLKNVSGRDLTNLRVSCHGLLDGSCFGGTTYQYDIAFLPAGGSAVIQAVDCILGVARAVRVEPGD